MSAAPAHQRARRHAAVALALLAVISGTSVTGSGPATADITHRPAPKGSDPFRPGEAYTGDFPDPSVLRAGSRYYAASTSISELNLPMTTSTDLVTWTSRPAPPPDPEPTPEPDPIPDPFPTPVPDPDPGPPPLNDAMPEPASWAEHRLGSRGNTYSPTWAPSLMRLARDRYLVAYSVPRASDRRRCLSIARATHPLGPYVDRTSAPLTCAGQGVIDPHLFRDRGALWLLHKVESAPDRIVVRRLTVNAAAFAPRSRAFTLLTPKATWEGAVVENPAMMRVRGRLQLFYSGNGYGSPGYSTGHATCRRVTGRCHRMGRLLSRDAELSGTGGAEPFLDTAGRLRLAYHAWRTGQEGYPDQDDCLDTEAGCPQRRLYVATLAAGSRGRLVVRQRH